MGNIEIILSIPTPKTIAMKYSVIKQLVDQFLKIFEFISNFEMAVAVVVGSNNNFIAQVSLV